MTRVCADRSRDRTKELIWLDSLIFPLDRRELVNSQRVRGVASNTNGGFGRPGSPNKYATLRLGRGRDDS